MKRILSIFLLLAIAISLFAGVPAQAAGLPITSTEEDSIVPSPWDNALPETPDVSSIPEETLTYTAQEVAGTYSAKAADLPFSDVHSNAWYYDDVVYVYEAGIMLGVSDTKFAPNASLTRAEVVTVLYRLEGSPSVDGTSNFWDVPQDAYFADAVTWAARNGIVKGVTTQEFCPHKAITREQIAAILYRYYADYLGNTPSSASLNGYTDQDAVSGFARDAMAWAVCSGLIRGVNASNEAPRLDPKATSNRAQVATLMHRLDVILDGGSLCRSSQRIIDFIKAKEGFSATPYWDYSQYTIGYGTCCGYTKEEVPASYWNGITREEAEVLLRKAIAADYEASVSRYESRRGRRFTHGEFDALVSFTFNQGAGWMYDNCRLTRWLENPETDLQLVWAMGVWCRAGDVLPALCQRRVQESLIFLYDDYTGQGSHPNYCYTVYRGNGELLTPRYTDDVGFYVLGETYGTLPTPSSSRDFLGWDTNRGEKITSSSTVHTDQTLTARWN